MVISVQSGCIITLSEIEEFKGAFFFGKIQKWICDLGSIDSSASKKKKKKKEKNAKSEKMIIFQDNANKQTQSCVQFKKQNNQKKNCG